MATTYKLKTALDAAVPYDEVQVEKSQTLPAVKSVVTPGQLKNEIASIDEKIASLNERKTEIQAELTTIQTEADKVTAAIKEA